MPSLANLLPDPTVLELKDVVVDPADQRLDITVVAAPQNASCPCCSQPSQRVHSRYLRTLADLPWAGYVARLLLHVRRWFCDHADCPRRIFTERLPTVVAPRGRRTKRLATAEQRIGLALGGSAGTRLSTDLAMPAGIDLLLTLVRQAPLPTPPMSPHIGIDDWAKRKGHGYGSIIVDLDTHQPMTLLDDRSADQVAGWLSAHPEVRVVSRDRGQVYIDGVTRGAPQAVQVADRWHLIKNLSEALLQVLQKHHRALDEALQPSSATTSPPSPIITAPSEPISTSTVTERPLTAADQRRQARYEAIHELHQRGWSQRAIAQHLHLERKTVRTYLRMGEVVTPRQRPTRRSRLDPFKPYLLERWNAGSRNAMQLLRELQAKGFTGKRSVVRAFLTQLRKTQGLPPRSRSTPPNVAVTDPMARPPSARALTWLVIKRKEKLSDDECAILTRLADVHPDITTAITLTQEFTAMVRERAVEPLEEWMALANKSGLRPLRAFVGGLKQDETAVRAALSLGWSQGPVEGNINRLKLLKRQMVRRVTHRRIAPAGSLEQEGFLGAIGITLRRKTRGKAALQKRGDDLQVVRVVLR